MFNQAAHIEPVTRDFIQSARSISNDITIDIDRKMLDTCASPCKNDALISALEYHLFSGGGRTRAKLSLHTSTELNIPYKDAACLATAVELLHNASLIQDDFQDEDNIRRNRHAVWAAYGLNTAVGLVDLMIASAFKVVTEIDDVSRLPALVSKLQAAISRTLHGQTLDLQSSFDDTPNIETTLMIARNKSGPLFALGLELPLLYAGLESHCDTAFDAACAFGTGYQVIDDLTDVSQDKRTPHANSTMIALEARHGEEQAAIEAMLLADFHLRRAIELSLELPHNAGWFLQQRGAQLLELLREMDRAYAA